ncbi:MAG TPA: hypothetical protein VIY72_15800 [Acidimicrobiales bacterium]
MAEDEAEPVEPDPFAGLTLDEEFVRGAAVEEQSAEARLERLRRIDAEHARLERERANERRAAKRVHRRGRRTQVLVLVVFVGALVGLGAWNYLNDTRGRGAATVAAPGFGGDGRTRGVGGQARPPAGVEAQDAPLGEPAPLATRSGSYSFLARQPDGVTPVAYDPCRPVHVVVNNRTAVVGGQGLLEQALASVSSATGFEFVLDGPTDEAPDPDREAYQPERYPGRWAPILVAWSDPGEVDQLEGDIAGLGGSTWLETESGSVYVSGAVELDGPQLAEILLVEGPAGVQAVIEHELAHVMGLDHVEDPAQLMNPVGTLGVTTFAAGDRTGLDALGRGRCFPDV